MASLKSVDKLTVRFIVDNSIEWFTQLPPGFTHELRQHLADNPPIDPLTGVPFVDLENYCCGAHGFSALIETGVASTDKTEKHTILFDSGPDSKSIARNLASLHIPLLSIERVVLSHWHSDHSGGILSLLNLRKAEIAIDESKNQGICIDLHPDRPIARGIAPRGPVIARLPPDPTFTEIQERGGTVELHAEEHVVAGGTVYVSGEIPRITSFETGLLGAVRWFGDEVKGEGAWKPEEDLMDERYAAIDVAGKGLVIFSACSHAGIVNVTKDAVSRFKRPIHMIIGGLHLSSPDLIERIKPTVDFLTNKLRPAPTYVLPMHCSGFDCKVALEHALGQGCVPAGVGLKVEVEGDRGLDSALFAPTMTL